MGTKAKVDDGNDANAIELFSIQVESDEDSEVVAMFSVSSLST